MRNVKMSVKDNTLTITIDLSKELGESKSRKSMLVASTGGNVLIGDDGIKIGVNCYKPKSE